MDPVRLNILINHVPAVLALLAALAVVFAMFRARHGIWMYATASLSIAAITMLPTLVTGGLAAHALGGPFTAAPPAADGPVLLARIAAVLLAVAGLAGTVAWRRLVRYPRELRMPASLRAAVVVSSLAAAIAVTSAVLLGA